MIKNITVFVSPAGFDSASGTLRKPVRSLNRALVLIRQRRNSANSPVDAQIVLRGGTHFLTHPIVLTPDDSGIAPTATNNTESDTGHPLLIASAKGERAIISGGRIITGFRQTTVNGVAAWVAHLPNVKTGRWNFNQLWVNGHRARRTHLPENGYFRIAEPLDDPARESSSGTPVFRGHQRFRFAGDDLSPFKNLTDAEFVALHFWIESRIPFKSINPHEKIAHLAWRPRMQLTDDFAGGGAVYYVENIMEALRKPGQWYLDRPAGNLYYIPRRGETIGKSEVIAPVLQHLLCLEGNAEKGNFVQHIRIENITFSHNEYTPDTESRIATPQAACHVPGAIIFNAARRCEIRNCTLKHIGSYGIEVIGGSADCDITHTTIRDTAAGGVKVFHSSLDTSGSQVALTGKAAKWLSCRRITVSDCHIHDGGYRNRQAVGVLVGRCSGCRILRNHIHDFDYTGISVGWTWGYAEGDACGNIIEYNHIHHIGRGVLSDMGGIYTLGHQQGTRIRYNVIHDVESRGYGGWGIYTDEGSTDILIESNLVYRTKSQGFHQHYGRRTIICNNIFAFGREGQMRISRVEAPHLAATFHRNIVVSDVPDTWVDVKDGWTAKQPKPALHLDSDYNLYWFTKRFSALKFAGRSFAQWQRLGFDKDSIIANPAFADLAAGDFTLKSNSPAIRKLNFIPWDISAAGPKHKRFSG
jgi:hypothetical protein